MGVDLTEGATDAGACDTEQTQLDREVFGPVGVHVRSKAQGDPLPSGQFLALST
jgi:hypothetical protein